MVFSDGKWVVLDAIGDGAGHAHSVALNTGRTTTEDLETLLCTLHVEPYTLLTADEQKDQANCNKASTGKKRQLSSISR